MGPRPHRPQQRRIGIGIKGNNREKPLSTVIKKVVGAGSHQMLEVKNSSINNEETIEANKTKDSLLGNIKTKDSNNNRLLS